MGIQRLTEEALRFLGHGRVGRREGSNSRLHEVVCGAWLCMVGYGFVALYMTTSVRVQIRL